MSIRHPVKILACLTLIIAGCSPSTSDPPAGTVQNGVSPSSSGTLTEEQILADKHPLAPAWKFAREVEDHIRKDIHDYTAVLATRERFPDQQEPYVDRKISIKIRHKPFSAYFLVLEPKDHKGEEAIYVEGQNDGKAIVHTTGLTGWVIGNKSLDPTGAILMRDQHYPMTDIGFLNLARRLQEQAAKDMQYDDCEVKFSEDAKFDDRPCTCITVVHSERRKEFIFHKAKVYVDKQWKVPLCYEAYDWPSTPGGEPPLIERFEYHDLKINPGLTDLDFSIKNPKYGYYK
jgi:hypothetical protein